MPRSQEFGFVIENLVRTRIHNLPPKSNDTGVHDISKQENHYDKTQTESIKTTGSNAIDCGDALRFFSYDMTENHAMVVFRFKQLPSCRKIVETLVLKIDSVFMKAMFGTVTRDEIKALDTYVKAIPPNARTAEHQKYYKQAAKSLKEKSGGWISYAPKVDSKTQRRLQCSIRNLDQFLEKYPQCILARSSTPTHHGITLETEYPFSARVRNSKKEEKVEEKETEMQESDSEHD